MSNPNLADSIYSDIEKILEKLQDDLAIVTEPAVDAIFKKIETLPPESRGPFACTAYAEVFYNFVSFGNALTASMIVNTINEKGWPLAIELSNQILEDSEWKITIEKLKECKKECKNDNKNKS